MKTLEARAQNAEAHAASLSVQVQRTQRRISEQQKRVGELDHELSLARREVERKEIERQDDDAAHAACKYKCLFWQAQFLFYVLRRKHMGILTSFLIE